MIRTFILFGNGRAWLPMPATRWLDIGCFVFRWNKHPGGPIFPLYVLTREPFYRSFKKIIGMNTLGLKAAILRDGSIC
jgi:hypothetical protein